MVLSKLQAKGFRLFKDLTTVKLHRGLNLLVGENGYGKSVMLVPIVRQGTLTRAMKIGSAGR